MSKTIGRTTALTVSIVCAVGMAAAEYGIKKYSDDEALNEILQTILTRGYGSVMFTVLLFYLGYRVVRPQNILRSILFALPCFAVVINNLPIIALLRGDAYLVKPTSYILLFALGCLLIGLFEETAFRGAIFLMLLEKRRNDTKQIFWTAVWSSAIFGGIHLFNLIGGAGIGATLQQVGYSFLIGGMCSVVLLKTKNIWLCALLHAIFDFCGYLIPLLGDGSLWDTPTIIITAVLAVAVTAYIVTALLNIRPDDINDIFITEKTSTEEKNNV